MQRLLRLLGRLLRLLLLLLLLPLLLLRMLGARMRRFQRRVMMRPGACERVMCLTMGGWLGWGFRYRLRWFQARVEGVDTVPFRRQEPIASLASCYVPFLSRWGACEFTCSRQATT